MAKRLFKISDGFCYGGGTSLGLWLVERCFHEHIDLLAIALVGCALSLLAYFAAVAIETSATEA